MQIIMQRIAILATLIISGYTVRQTQYNGSSITLSTPMMTIPTNTQTDPSLILLQNSIIDTIRTAGPSVVNIVITKNLQFYLTNPFRFWERGEVVEQQTRVGGGSGIFVNKSGLLMTNKHVMSDMDAQYSVITADGSTYTVQNIWIDPLIDIAFAQIVDSEGKMPTDLPSATFIGFDDSVQVGQFALAIGNALAEYQDSVTMGIISAKNRKLETNENNSLYVGLYQTDTPINPGNSGGPLIDIFGRVIGVNTAIAGQGANIGFSIPVTKEFVEASVASITQYQKIRRPLLGIGYTDLTKMIAQEKNISTTQGTLIEQIVQGSAAQQVGLIAGDIILGVDGKAITADLPFLYHIYQHQVGETITLTYQRAGKTQEISVTLGSGDSE